MPTISDYPRGSEWRKWDLHIHTPASVLANRFEGSTEDERWNNYLDTLETLEDTAVLGVTDYFSIDGFLRLMQERNNGRLQNIDCILPNIELRILPATERNIPINIHVIFDPEIISSIDSDFFQDLKYEYRGTQFKCDKAGLVRLGRSFREDGNLPEKAAFRIGVEQVKLSFSELRSVLEGKKNLKDRYLIAVPNSNQDGNSGQQGNGYKSLREEIYRFSNIIFSGNPSDVDFFLGKKEGIPPEEVIAKCGSLKPCVNGSDAHSCEMIDKIDLDRFTWIKADPTFEGLKQIIHEPGERVAIQTSNPSLNFPKTHFSRLVLGGGVFEEEGPVFAETDLPVNANMVAIIGGRGTGKSLLLDVLYKAFRPQVSRVGHDNMVSDRIANMRDVKFNATVTKSDGEDNVFKLGDDSNQFEYLHVRQGEVRKIAEDQERLAEAIYRLLGYVERDIDKELDNEYVKISAEIDNKRLWLLEKNEEGDSVNNESYNRGKIESLKALINIVTTKETKFKIDEYISNTIEISRVGAIIERLNSLLAWLEAIKNDINKEIAKLNDDLKNDDAIIPELELEKQFIHIKVAQSKMLNKEKDLLKINKETAKLLADKGIKGDIEGQLEKIEEYQRKIEYHEQVIRENQGLQAELSSLKQKREKLAERFDANIQNRVELIGQKYNEKKGKSKEFLGESESILEQILGDIDIKGEILFKNDVFWKKLERFFDGRKLRSRPVSEIFKANNYQDYLKMIAGERVIWNMPSEEQLTLDEFIDKTDLFLYEDRLEFAEVFFSDRHRKEYLKVVPVVKYKGKEPQKLSVGQRGTFYVCLKLATETFMTPFIFDQPEDDLDNQFIISELKPIFRAIKKYRQVIIVTHSANLVVNCDTEQIIVANNEDENIYFEAGSLENEYIKNKVCTILEGGEEAFKMRERRYNISK